MEGGGAEPTCGGRCERVAPQKGLHGSIVYLPQASEGKIASLMNQYDVEYGNQ